MNLIISLGGKNDFNNNEAVAKALKEAGISQERIIVDYKGDTVQPFSSPEQNRVSICVVE